MFCEGELWYIIVDSACRGRIIYHTYPNKTYIYSGPSCLSPNIHLQSLKIYLHFITRMQGFRGRLAGYRLVRAWRGIAHMGIFRLQLRGSLAIFIYVLWGWAMIYNFWHTFLYQKYFWPQYFFDPNKFCDPQKCFTQK